MASTRTFLAIPASNELKRQVAKVCRQLDAKTTGIRWLAADQLHLTLCFLGEVDDDLLPLIHEATLTAIAAAGVSRFVMGLKGLGCFPTPARPRVLWAAVIEGHAEVLRLQVSLQRQLQGLGLTLESRPYTPHLTLGKLRADRKPQDLTNLIESAKDLEFAEQIVEEIQMVGSELTSAGSIYTVLHRAALPAVVT